MTQIWEAFSDIRKVGDASTNPRELSSAIGNMLITRYPTDPYFARLLDIFDNLQADYKTPPTDNISVDEPDSLYINNIRALSRNIVSLQSDQLVSEPIRSVPMSFDFLVSETTDWSAAKATNFALLQAIIPTQRAAIVVSIKDEGLSIIEWLAHHKSIGFDAIFVYTNNNTDSSLPLLKLLAEHNLIYLFENDAAPTTAPQLKAFEHSLNFLPELRKYEWLFYLDADEFFIPRCEPALSLESFFDKLRESFSDDNPPAILFNWKWFGSENIYHYEDSFLLERFQYSKHNAHVKCMARSRDLLSAKRLHVPTIFPDRKFVNSAFEYVIPHGVEIPPVYRFGQVNHYWAKSFEEFVIKKLRGRGAVSQHAEQRSFSNFFDWGENAERGNFDPPPKQLLAKTKILYEEILLLPGVADSLSTVRSAFRDKITAADIQLGLSEMYKRRGLS